MVNSIYITLIRKGTLKPREHGVKNSETQGWGEKAGLEAGAPWSDTEALRDVPKEQWLRR